MTIAVKKNLVLKAKYALKCPNPMTAEYITIHNTYNDASAANEVSYMIGNTSSTSFHFAVDDKEVR
ncbi:N-acetylmuramoyl-L-alanine amidase, phage associated [Bacillus subtilis]|nr:N-acetylmuramoyl-L-alanine amidase, phage associated [Bacillus subtilis]